MPRNAVISRSVEFPTVTFKSRLKIAGGNVRRSKPPSDEIRKDHEQGKVPTRFRTHLLVLGLSVRHLPILMPLITSPTHTALGRLIRKRPEVWRLVLSPYISRSWDVQTRFRMIADHCAATERLGAPFNLGADDAVELLKLPELGEGYRMTLNQTRWSLREGPLAISLVRDDEQLFSLAFGLSSIAGEDTAYVAAIQGRRIEGVLDTYRHLTKAAYGVRPRDLTIEIFRALCAAVGIKRILAVSDLARTAGAERIVPSAEDFDKVKMSYDEIWLDRGAHRVDDDFFSLPIHARRRTDADVPTRKRSIYRRRYAMLDSIQSRLLWRLAGLKD